ncbi:MAG: ComF family protein [Porticoccaceae bacterium]|nr:ComF family protein [Porticoccaceae bacterium]
MAKYPLPPFSTLAPPLRRWLKAAEYQLLPGLCLRCAQPSGRQLDLCPGCESDFAGLGRCCSQCAVPLPLSTVAQPTPLCGNCLVDPPEFSRLIAAYRYEAPLSALVIAAKNHRDLAAAQVLGKLLAAHLIRQLTGQPKPDLLVPVPLHWRRRLVRGYNQALELARPVSRALNIPLQPRLASRVRYLAQQGLGRDERRRQLQGAFKVNSDISNRRIAIIDDVVTTTGTARALSQALLDTGATAVEVWCLARTPSRVI